MDEAVAHQTVQKLSASSDAVGAAILRPCNNFEEIVAVFEENKKIIAIAERPMVAPTGYCGGFFDRSVLF